MSEGLREKLKEYYKIQHMSANLSRMRSDLVRMIKAEELTKKKFLMSEGTYLVYNNYTRPGELSIRLVTDTLNDLGIPSDGIINEIKRRRELERKHIETIKLIHDSPKKN
jgi:hypothetical protein